jgi:cytosine/adenosine deaminase-related metal-dependent hydrolase
VDSIMQRVLHLAPIVYNGLGTPRRNGGLLVQEALDTRTVVAAGDGEELRAMYPDAEIRQEPFALSPAPANAHTHLDLTGMPYTAGTYESFIRAVIDHGRNGGRSLAKAEAGVSELLDGGTTVIGDIVTREEVMAFLLAHPRLRGVAYWEVIGPDPAEAERILKETEERLKAFRAQERPGGMRVGLSPHTPHTVSAPLLRGLSVLARKMRIPVQIHVAESAGEVPLHRDGRGPLARALEGFLPSWAPSGLSPVGYLESLGVLEAAPTLVHMVHVTEEDVALVQKYGCAVVHCPRSNLALECGRFPWSLYARHGVTVALGTDSRGSSPSLSVEEEVAAAVGIHGSSAGTQALVRAAVKGGHRALGLTPPRFVRGDDAALVHSWRAAAGN